MSLALPVAASGDSLGLDPPVNPPALSLTPEQNQLAHELGWETADPEVVPWLQSLLDDEFEQLAPAARGRLRSRVDGQAGAEVCPDCGNVFLLRFRPDDARCRVCAAPLDAPASRVAALSPSLDPAPTPEAAWSQAPLALGETRVDLDAENEDWDEREDRLEAEREAQRAAERELEARRRRQHELARQQAEARREAREAKRRALTELIPPVSDERLTKLKQKAHADIEARLKANRRKRRLLRGGKARPR